ncbi:MAG: DUF2461 domain-containing protein [Flavobacteriaceae bacterium]|nr:DUF2461 domain-containing protein [Flavobacteriaceae bacterium]
MSIAVPKSALDFFKKLQKNNNREWFTEHKSEFKAIEAEVKTVYNELYNRLNAHDEVDKLKIFRIYRDVRFSKDKTPYKTHFSGSFHRKKPQLRGGYYLHIQPNHESFVAAGFWQPNKEDLLRIRKEFEIDASEIRDIMNNSNFKAIWGKLEGTEVKTAPKGFSKTHQNIDLIKKKMYIFTRKFSDNEVLAPEFVDTVVDSFQAIRPFFDYMSDVLTTDLNGVSRF